MAPIQFAHAKGIVEYGPGTGIFTEQLIDHKNDDTVLLVIESNTEFYEPLKEKYNGIPNVHIIHGSHIEIIKVHWNIPPAYVFICQP
nr:rRNA adenine N-6-methyltransferase family protein [Bacillus sp. UNC438CL73TsuS30]